MIISKTPFRVSLFGGSTDYVSYYENNGATLIGFAMNKYCYVTMRELPKIFNYKSRLVYSKTEEVQDNKDIKHPGIRATLDYLNIDDGVEVCHMADLPSQTGIGSSSSFIVGLLNSCYVFKDIINGDKIIYETPDQLATSAIEIERYELKEAGGIQDQYFAAYGGFISIHIEKDSSVHVKPLPISKHFISEFMKRSVMIYTGNQRNSFDIAKSHDVNSTNKHKIQELANEAYQYFVDNNIIKIAKSLDKTWELKKGISDKISNKEIDDLYDNLKRDGMIGGKLLGSGGSGFIFGVCEDESSAYRIRRNFENSIDIGCSFSGSEIINVSRD